MAETVELPERKPCQAVRERLATTCAADLLAEVAERRREDERNALLTQLTRGY